MKSRKIAAIVVIAVAVAAPLVVAFSSGQLDGVEPRRGMIGSTSLFNDGLSSIGAATEWVNSAPLMPADLRGKVVLVEFWTYSCINWRRQLPFVRAWADKYRDQGLVVIGVHTPEFAFEKDVANIRQATSEMGVRFPVVVDSDYRIWNAFGNRAWPALYFIDAKGRVRHQYFGEGEYARSEKLLRQLLEEAGAKGVPSGLVAVDGRGLEAPPDFGNLRSPEAYIGYERAEGFASAGGVARNKARIYTAPSKLALNDWALSGEWTVEMQRAISNQPGARIAHRFHARDVHMVMGSRGGPVRFRVLLDGRAPGADHGTDVDEQGYGTATQPTLYQLVRQKGSVGDRQFEIEFLDAGAEAYSFTFG